ncbi:uncharacterized protein LOC130012518 [Patella vulgata]|uniref:uncharacterized protein LOC130012518 n=1 Tax=Patella vulgata TaxID=6465 RepID=UPI0024A800DA|nr:uncharacterized protein LOC130012518 [Patella vulgata]
MEHREKKKILGNSLTLSNSDVLPLGFRHVATETAQIITSTTQTELSEVASCGQTVVTDIVRKLSYVMSDRAANEKLSNHQITEWKDDLLKEYDGEEDRSTIYSFYCMVHVLLGYHSYAVKHLNRIQKELEDKGIKLGRDQTVLYRREIAGVRTVRFISDLLGPVPDEKNDLRERWLAYCRIHNIKSLIGSYKDNRFNCLFETSAQVLFHRKDILNFFSDLQTTNLKVKSANLDLLDGKIVAIITSLASVYFKISGPYWDAMTSGHCNYLSLHEYVQPMYQKIMLWVKDPLSILNVNDDPLFEDFPDKSLSCS